jgi:2-amino-4-hydroxy-6-hydroxymethyldihydropteridine diphosphokinase
MTEDFRVPTRRGALALGSNLGDRAAHLLAGARSLGTVPGITVVGTSAVYESEAVGGPEQGPFLNAVLLIDTDLPAEALIDAAMVAEAMEGRVRDGTVPEKGPRTLDVDVLVLGDEVSEDPRITLPHPRAHERAFVLVPWAEVDPEAVLPRWGRVIDLLGALPAVDRASVRLSSDLGYDITEQL